MVLGRLRLGGLDLRLRFVVQSVRALIGFAGCHAVAVADEPVLLGQHVELHRELDLRADE